ncbi:hypothetical protein A3B18_00015 [Candidatus Giovannonibacteria bacterium RIFCSPLOWO2_01_FULL_46_13]|uniref:GGDEF domain-containing protein n=1 Tax=Candidatus Giovannonibacteria bacterium RIFCSPLOWO2_01_FULL_46_13 TaxID=1798352 RepID=A0A1F5X5X9_9BACT|nr:MAG: hypothetical protein A3B18_00015 [Candidatus Giovannonibacteria bacterium RIFCSPLOWO2_01_FULL_46_13]
MRVLIVNKEECERQKIRSLVIPIGKEFIYASTGEDALRVLQEKEGNNVPVQLMVTDLELQGELDGLNLALETNRQLEYPPYMVLTSRYHLEREKWKWTTKDWAQFMAVFRKPINVYGFRIAINVVRNAMRREEELAIHRFDSLTGLLTRQTAEKKLRRIKDAPFSILFIDIDFFNQINKEHGRHSAGDGVLKAVAGIIESHVSPRRGDIISRWGGDEYFVCMMTTLPHATEAAEKIQESMKLRIHLEDGRALPVSLSIGVATRRGPESWEDVFKRADEGLYTAKQSGKSCIKVAA